MKRHIITILLALCMILSLLPILVFAIEGEETGENDTPEDYIEEALESFEAAGNTGVWVKGIQATPENSTDILGDGKFSFNKESSTLTIKSGAKISVDDSSCIFANGTDLNIVAEGSVELYSKNYSAVKIANGSLNMTGGEWKINSDNYNAVRVYTEGETLTLSDLSINAGTESSYYYSSILVRGDFAAENSRVKLKSTEDGSQGINTWGSVTLKDCPEIDIDSATDAISAYGVVIESCGLDINAECNCIYSCGVWEFEDEDDTEGVYVSDGDVTIRNCSNAVLDSSSDYYTAVFADGSVKIENCPDMDIKGGWDGIDACYGEAEITDCDNMRIEAVEDGIYSTEDVTVIGSSITVKCGIPEVCEEKHGEAITDYADYTDGIYTDGLLTVKNSTLDLVAADLGFESQDEEVIEEEGDYWGYKSYGIYAGDAVIKDSTVTARSTCGDFASGIYIENSLSVSGKTTINAYGGIASDHNGNNYYGIYSNGDVILDGKDVVVNLYGGSYTDSSDITWKEAFLAERNSEDDNLPLLTVKNGAKLNADAYVWVEGDMLIDGGRVNIYSPIDNALCVGNESDNGELFGTLTVKNDSSLIAVSDDTNETYSSVYAYKNVDISDSMLFISAKVGDTIGCENPINFNGLELTGSLSQISYEDRASVNTPVEIGYTDEIKEYTALIGEAPALTLYTPMEDVFFTDVPESSFFYNPVAWAAKNGITKGTDKLRFSPAKDVTRAEAVTFLWRAAGCPKVDCELAFDDVLPGKYYTDAVRWAVAEGITKGVKETGFAPNAVCTRGQIVTFLYRFAKASSQTSENPFTDVKKGPYYYEAVLWAVENGITTGMTDTAFAPNADCSRAQVVTFLYRFIKK